MEKNNSEDYKEINRKAWNQRTDLHVQSEFYAWDKFIAGEDSLNGIELELLGDVTGKSILHLQCHFGQDSISLARRGAYVTGVDLSDKSIEMANKLASLTGQDLEFICCDLYDAPQHLSRKYDIVFTSYGTIGWLPDLKKWASVISYALKPGGIFVMAEFHPVVWMFDDNFESVAYNYFKDEAIIESDNSSYAGPESDEVIHSVSWNHSIHEVMGNLIGQNMQILDFKEYNYSPYDCFQGTEEFQPGRFRIQKFGNKIPMIYAIKAFKTHEKDT